MPNERCESYLPGLVELASGASHPEAAAHAAVCAECASRLAQLERTVSLLALRPHHAPPELIQAATAIFPQRLERHRARLVSSTLAGVGARSAVTEGFQLVFEAQELHLRLMLERSGKSWNVLGRLQGGGEVVHGGQNLEVDAAGRFSLVAKDLADTALLVRRADADIEIPSAEEAVSGGQSGAD